VVVMMYSVGKGGRGGRWDVDGDVRTPRPGRERGRIEVARYWVGDWIENRDTKESE